MGSPKRIRKKYEKPSMKWDLQRIKEDHKLKEQFGLKNLRELWIAQSELRRIRRITREVLSGALSNEIGDQLIKRLVRYNIVKNGTTLDDLLAITPEAILERRLQSIVFKRGLAKTIKQARQLITHGFIAIDGMRVTSPGKLISADEETKISYYKPIKIFEESKASSNSNIEGTPESNEVEV